MREDDRPLSVLEMACSICCLACAMAAASVADDNADDASATAAVKTGTRWLLDLTAPQDLPFRLNAVTIVDDGISAIIIANNIKMAASGATEMSAVDDGAMVVVDFGDSRRIVIAVIKDFFVEGGLRQNGSLCLLPQSVTFKSEMRWCAVINSAHVSHF